MVLFTIMQPWAHITLHTLLHSWTPYMTCSLMFRDQSRPDTSSYGTMLSFHRAALVRNWFTDHPLFTVLNLPHTLLLESNWRVLSLLALEVYDRHPHQRIALLQAMEEACGILTRHHVRPGYAIPEDIFPGALGLEDIACDVDEFCGQPQRDDTM